jgi:hypothetical protein
MIARPLHVVVFVEQKWCCKATRRACLCREEILRERAVVFRALNTPMPMPEFEVEVGCVSC